MSATDEEREDDEREEKLAQDRARRQRYLSPLCCDAMRRCKAIVASCSRPDEEPKWYLRLRSSSGEGLGFFDVELFETEREWYRTKTTLLDQHFVPHPSHCPFCGAAMPTLLRKAYPPEPLCVDDGAGHCSTCTERICNCACYPPWLAWQTAAEAMQEAMERT